MPAPHRRTTPWLYALGLSLSAHAALVLHQGEAAHPRTRSPSMQTRQLPIPIPAPAPPAAPVAQRKPAQRLPAAPVVEAPAPEPPPPLAIPAAGEWTYRLRQNGQEGIARLRWQPEGDRYELRLERELAGRPLPTWLSRGGFDASGLAPQRFTHQRNGRDAQAANFRREEQLISFSASPALLPLPAGVQDRLSWWLQVPARIAAAPRRHPPGSSLILHVAGLRGELQEWRFEVVDEEAGLQHLRREALGPYDGQLELWLDPQQGHRPVRLRLLGTAGETLWELDALK